MSDGNLMSSRAWEVVRGVLVVVVSTAIVSAALSLYRIASSGGPFFGGVPDGAVVAYDIVSGCPTGWAALENGGGRFVVGVGDGYEYRDTGGEDMVVLGVEQMPKHDHPVGPYEWGHTVDASGSANRIDVNDGPPYQGLTGVLVAEPMGGGAAHENRPPYVALHLCRKD